MNTNTRQGGNRQGGIQIQGDRRVEDLLKLI